MLTFFLRRLRWVRFLRLAHRQAIGETLGRTALYMGIVLALHTLAMMVIEEMPPGDAVWLTLTTVVTVGYGDLSATTPWGRAATVVLIYIGGIFVVFQSAAEYFEYRADRRIKMHCGQWRWNMKDHIVLLNVPGINLIQYINRLVREFRTVDRYRESPVMVVTTSFPDGLPERLQDIGVVHYSGHTNDPAVLRDAKVSEAKIIIVLAKQEGEANSDAGTFDILHRLKEQRSKATIVAECVATSNRDRLAGAGADIVVRPIRFYPEIVVRALVAPGTEEILANLFTGHGDSCIRYDVIIAGKSWIDVVTAVMAKDAGTAIAFLSHDGTIQTNPAPDIEVRTKALFVIVRQGHEIPPSAMKELLT